MDKMQLKKTVIVNVKQSLEGDLYVPIPDEFLRSLGGDDKTKLRIKVTKEGFIKMTKERRKKAK